MQRDFQCYWKAIITHNYSNSDQLTPKGNLIDTEQKWRQGWDSKSHFKTISQLWILCRANQSQLNFATGLFDRLTAQSEVEYEPAIDPDDPIIRFYKVCKKWKTEVKDNPVSKEQQRLLEQSKKVKSKIIDGKIWFRI